VLGCDDLELAALRRRPGSGEDGPGPNGQYSEQGGREVPHRPLTILIPTIAVQSRGAIVWKMSWSEQTIAALRAKGHRDGGARRAVVELLGRQRCCLTSQEIFDSLRAEGRRVGIASV